MEAVQLRSVDVSGHDTAHATYGITLASAASVPTAQSSSQKPVPWFADATNAAQVYGVTDAPTRSE